MTAEKGEEINDNVILGVRKTIEWEMFLINNFKTRKSKTIEQLLYRYYCCVRFNVTLYLTKI